ncbi:Hypothetical protein CKL_2878 [Clostridium kluyveri DSM 555]|uniref:Uncharacterized protein n=1 Tax=Clostridium kluyveri (strain ATCC 8527 / DSM 555 / NBRC 12016 / NCIMB 10680 / K1) TaxID=431943 RepID=A5N194_CLOK5|nr:Hypothetical protein CKL_2878 [Clostridium kluyveri DSM 555]
MVAGHIKYGCNQHSKSNIKNKLFTHKAGILCSGCLFFILFTNSYYIGHRIVTNTIYNKYHNRL